MLVPLNLLIKICSGELTMKKMQNPFLHSRQKKKNHVAFSVKESGLVINPNFPHFGASPDALISCRCCGEVILEIKCLFILKDAANKELLSKTFYLTICNYDTQLKKGNPYYY